jgi:hypothetical protein
MNRFALLACTSVAALSLDGCLLNWNQFRPSDAAADVASRPDAEDPDTGVVVDSGVLVDTGVRVDTGVDSGVDTGVVLDSGVDTGVLVDTGVPVDARADAAIDARPDSAPDVVTSDADPGCTGPVVINEVVHTGNGGGSSTPGTDEFVELHNNGTCTVDLTGWRVQYMSASGSVTMASPQAVFLAGDVIGPNRQIIVASSVSPLAPMALRTFTAGIAQTGGGIALFNQRMERVDSVAFGSLSVAGGHPYAEPVGNTGAPTYSSAPQSVARTPNGTDTNNNAADFRAAANATPGAPNP